MSEEKVLKDHKEENKYWSQYRREEEKRSKEYRKSLEKLKSSWQGKSDVMDEISEAFAEETKEENGFRQWLLGTQRKRVAQLKEYKANNAQRDEISKMYTDPAQRDSALYLFNKNRQERGSIVNDGGVLGKAKDEAVDKVAGTVSGSLADAFMDMENFGAHMKKLGTNLLKDLTEIAVKSLVQVVINKKNMDALIGYSKDSMGAVFGSLGNIKDMFGEMGGDAWDSIKKWGGDARDSIFGKKEGNMTGGAAGLLTGMYKEDASGGVVAGMKKAMGDIFGKDGPLGGIASTLGNMLSSIFGSGGMIGKLFGALGSGLSGILGGAMRGGSGIFSMLGSFLPKFKFHSGGVVPSGAGLELPGTKEQLALLKGGERVLSPAENTSYKGREQASAVNVLNFNIKAWDSKDVQKYLLENRQLLNSITFQGIKDNNQQLRQIVRNA